ncbi:MAG: arsenite methyltransferase [Chloroflexi bacterium]|nr:arsenite methyltransferase [Chloroflexota bacterium]
MVEQNEVKEYVRERYAERARGAGGCCGGDSGSGSSALKLYSKEELDALPQMAADISLGCGNPVALASLLPGETVLDLGSGGGIDCLLASKRVGPSGRVIGLDMTPEMIALARENAARMDARNVEFRLGDMERMPVADESVDVIISNCVINLSPDKDAVLGEAYRVLKPGGRFCVSDIVMLKELPEQIRRSLEQWAGCVAGALSKDGYLGKLDKAGFTDVKLDFAPVPVGDFKEYAKEIGFDDAGWEDLASAIASATIEAHKPEA